MLHVTKRLNSLLLPKRALLLSPRRMLSAGPAKHADNVRTWKMLSLGVVPVVLALMHYQAGMYPGSGAHAERPPFVKYEHLRIRTKAFPWGDGNHSLFHHPHNALPDGYEDE